MERPKPEAVFLALACSFGFAVLLANAPFQAPDENDHFARAFQLSEGTLIGERRGSMAGGDLPRPAVAVTNTEGMPFHYESKMTHGLFGRLSNPAFVDWSRSPRVFLNFPHTVVYSPAGYLPQAVVLFFGRHLRIGPLGLMYLARLAGLAVSVALGYAALRALPIYRWTTLVLLLCPMSLYLLGSIAPDGVLITASALLMARLARLAVERDRPADFCEQATILVLAGTVSLAKPVYVPFAAVAFFVMFPRLRSPRRQMIFGGALIVCCLLPAALWSRIAVSLFVPGKGDVPLDPVGQVHNIIQAPLAFIALVAHTIRVQYLYNFRWMVGTLGWGDTPMPGWFYATFGFGVLGCLFMESGRARGIRCGLRLVMIAAAASSVLLIYVAQYSTWNPPGSRAPIDGIEGRYFLPVLPLVALTFPAWGARFPRAVVTVLASGLAVTSAVTCLSAVILRYYVASPRSAGDGKAARLVNVSTRAQVGSRENAIVAGFVVAGHGMETVLIRAAGPSLSTFGLSGVLARPSVLVLDSKGSVLASNTGWGTNSDPAGPKVAAAAVGAFEFAANSADSALVLSVPEGNYTFEVSGANGTSGIALAAIYEVAHIGTRLTNISTRAYVGQGANVMIVGFVVSGNGAERLLCRANGPSLRQFDVAGVLDRPTLTVGPLPAGDLTNTGWGTSRERKEIARVTSLVGAFPIPENGADSAAIVSVPPGSYTMNVRGADGTSGVALTEIYEIP